MLHSFVQNWVHIVWGTKNRERLLFKEVGQSLHHFLIGKSEELNAPLERLNIQPEHIHLLVNLPSNICLSDYVRRLKGSSTRWVNQSSFLDMTFAWQRGYGAFSVSQSQLEKVKRYITKQSEHHQRNSFEGEYELWEKEYIFERTAKSPD